MSFLGINNLQVFMDVEVGSLEETITQGHDVLRMIVQRDLKTLHNRFVQRQDSLVATQQLILALSMAQGKRDTLSSASAGQDDIYTVHENLLKAIKRIKVLMAEYTAPYDLDRVATTGLARDATIEALKTCFWETPFRIVARRVKEIIPQEVYFRFHGSPLVSLYRNDVPATNGTDLGAIPYFKRLKPMVSEWMTTQTVNTFQMILSTYTPLPQHLEHIQWLQKKSKLMSLSVGFKTRQRERYQSEIVRALRIGVLGLCGLGKSTLINALIGEDVLTANNGDWKTTSSLSSGWPIIIRHKQSAKVPRILIDPTNLIPILKILHEQTFDSSETPLQEPLVAAVWDEYNKSQISPLPMEHLQFEGLNPIRESLHAIGKVVRAFTPLSREGKQFQFNSSWPVIEVCMAAFHDVEQQLEFLDLPGIGNRKLVARDIEAQWKSSFDSCHAYIYTVKADLELLDAARLDLNLEYLKVSMVYKGCPWLIVATHSDQITRSPIERPRVTEELKLGFQSIIGGRGVVPFDVDVVLCSPAMDLCAKRVQHVLKQSSSLPSREDIQSAGGSAVLRAIGEGVVLSELPSGAFSRYLETLIQRSTMDDVSSMIKTQIIPQSLSLISKTAMSLTKDDIWCIRTDLRDVLAWSVIGNDRLENQRRLSFDYFQRAATFCASWSVKLLENQREWHRSVDIHLLNLRQSLQDGLAEVWNQLLRVNRLHKPDSAFFISNPLKAIKSFEIKAEDAHSLCEIRVKELAASVWEKCLGNLLEHLASHVFNDVEEESYQGLRQRVFDDIDVIRRQSCEQVLSKVIRRVGKRIGLEPSVLAEEAFWRAHEGSMRRRDTDVTLIEDSLHLLTDLPRDHNHWSRTPPVPTTLERVSYLEQWKRHTEIAANGLEAVGFLVVPPHTPPRFKTTNLPFGRGMNSTSLRTHLEGIQEAWYESMRQQSLKTIEGVLRAVSFIGIRAVLDVFIDQIQNLEGNKVAQAESQRMSVAEIEEVVVAESNAICAWAALDELTQIDVLDTPEE
ncbi:hypothetical protein FRC18_005828 [Serendipita sp. 400]|nr:hypothetical protein FRC18_005828 [Serendipita sp. 400]